MKYQEKLKKLKRILTKHKANQIILKSTDPNFKWLLEKEITKATLIITKNENTLITKPLESINKEFLKKDLKIITIKKVQDLKIITKNIKGITLTNHEQITLKDKEELNLKRTKDIKEELQELRSQKNEDEIKKIKKACEHTIKCWKQIIKKLEKKELKTEKQIEQHIKIYALKNNLELAFNPVMHQEKTHLHHTTSLKKN
jgi:Xaa-Pro aminopeptidase